ncbi:MAG: glycosyltransferase family 9 protein [Planctomycetales bacterium]|nr:glycosyltransferase family 9 protein [Planctomycetales bacterium]
MQPRFLIARMSAIGDTILTLPVACALRERFPTAHIVWAVEKGASSMVLGHPAVDQVIVLQRGWFASPSQILAARKLLRAQHIDIAIDCQSITKTSLACWLSGARTRIGLQGKYGCEASPWLNNLLVTPKLPHLTDRSLELLQPLGIQRPRVRWQFPLTGQHRETAATLVQQLGYRDRFAVVNPGATWDSKLWEMDRFGLVAQHLGRRHQVPTAVVWGNDREREWADQIVRHSDGWATLAPRTSLLELAAFIERASLFISSDTGPLHMAVAVGTPCIGLHGTTRPADSGAYGAPHISLQARFHDGSRRERRRADNAAMRELTTTMVTEATDRLFSPGHRMAG